MVRSRPLLRLGKSPLVYVLAQIRFSTVESIAKYVPEIQDRLRKKGFPRFSEGEMQNVRIAAMAQPEIVRVPRFEFQDPPKRAGIVLTKGFVSFHVGHYGTFEEFTTRFSAALDVVHAVVGLGLVERVGLRYVNLIRPHPDERLADYLEPGLLGLDPAKFQASDSRILLQMLSRTESGTLAVRLTQRDDGEFLPPDLESSSLDHGPVDVQKGELVSLLDLDHYTVFEKEGPEFSVHRVMDLIWRLHETTDLAFRSAVTRHAMEVWGYHDDA